MKKHPDKVRFGGAVYVKADQPMMPGQGGKLSPGPHMPHASPGTGQNQKQLNQVKMPQGTGQSPGGPAGPKVPLLSLPGQPPAKAPTDEEVIKKLGKFLHRLRRVIEVSPGEENSVIDELLGRYKMPGLLIILNEWRAAKDRLANHLDDAALELSLKAKVPEHKPDISPSVRLPQEPWPGAGGFKGGPTPA